MEKNQGIQPRTAQAATQEKKDIGDIGVKQTLKVIFGSKPSNYFFIILVVWCLDMFGKTSYFSGSQLDFASTSLGSATTPAWTSPTGTEALTFWKRCDGAWCVLTAVATLPIWTPRMLRSKWVWSPHGGWSNYILNVLMCVENDFIFHRYWSDVLWYYLNPFLVDKDFQHRNRPTIRPSDHATIHHYLIGKETKSWAILLQLVARHELHNELAMKNALISALTDPWIWIESTL